MRRDARVEPRLADVAGVDRQALAQRESGGGGPLGERVDLGPGPFRVDVVWGQRRDPAPVVYPGVQYQLVLIADQVRRSLDPRRRPEQQPGYRDRGGEVVEFGVG